MPTSDPRSYLASGKARAFAYSIDLCACGLLLVPTAYAAYCLGTHSAGTFEFSLLFFAYHTYFLAFKNGVSPGKYIQNIAVVSPRRRQLHMWQALVRATSLSLPWLLIAAGDSTWFTALSSKVALAVLQTSGAAWLVLDAVLIDYTNDRRSLTDRAASTIVVALPPPQPHRAPATPMFSATDAEFGTPPKKPPRS